MRASTSGVRTSANFESTPNRTSKNTLGAKRGSEQQLTPGKNYAPSPHRVSTTKLQQSAGSQPLTLGTPNRQTPKTAVAAKTQKVVQKPTEQSVDEPKRLRLDQLQKMLEEKLRALIEGLRTKQGQNNLAEGEALGKLGMLREINGDLESVYKDTNHSISQLSQFLDRQEGEHKNRLEKDQELLASRASLLELETEMARLKAEVEQASADL